MTANRIAPIISGRLLKAVAGPSCEYFSCSVGKSRAAMGGILLHRGRSQASKKIRVTIPSGNPTLSSPQFTGGQRFGFSRPPVNKKVLENKAPLPTVKRPTTAQASQLILVHDWWRFDFDNVIKPIAIRAIGTATHLPCAQFAVWHW
jgi:hypothetical protein